MTVLQALGGDVVDFQPMSPEEMQRTMQFVLHQQAQFAVDFAKLTEKTDRIAEGSARISDGLIGLTTIVGRLAAAQLRTDEELREQREQLKESREELKESREQLKEHWELLHEQRKHIDIIIQMFERHLRDDHGAAPS